MIVTSEYVFHNIKLTETRNIKENTPKEYDETYGYNYLRAVEVMCFAEFLDKIENETKKYNH